MSQLDRAYRLKRLSTVNEIQCSEDHAVLSLLARLHPALSQYTPFGSKSITDLAAKLCCESRETDYESMVSWRTRKDTEGLIIELKRW